MLHNADSQEESEAKFVFFEQRPTDVRIETKRHVFVDVLRPLGHVICKKTPKNMKIVTQNKLISCDATGRDVMTSFVTLIAVE